MTVTEKVGGVTVCPSVVVLVRLKRSETLKAAFDGLHGLPYLHSENERQPPTVKAECQQLARAHHCTHSRKTDG